MKIAPIHGRNGAQTTLCGGPLSCNRRSVASSSAELNEHLPHAANCKALSADFRPHASNDTGRRRRTGSWSTGDSSRISTRQTLIWGRVLEFPGRQADFFLDLESATGKESSNPRAAHQTKSFCKLWRPDPKPDPGLGRADFVSCVLRRFGSRGISLSESANLAPTVG